MRLAALQAIKLHWNFSHDVIPVASIANESSSIPKIVSPFSFQASSAYLHLYSLGKYYIHLLVLRAVLLSALLSGTVASMLLKDLKLVLDPCFSDKCKNEGKVKGCNSFGYIFNAETLAGVGQMEILHLVR